jgi:hypothetical protein
MRGGRGEEALAAEEEAWWRHGLDQAQQEVWRVLAVKPGKKTTAAKKFKRRAAAEKADRKAAGGQF